MLKYIVVKYIKDRILQVQPKVKEIECMMLKKIGKVGISAIWGNGSNWCYTEYGIVIHDLVMATDSCSSNGVIRKTPRGKSIF